MKPFYTIATPHKDIMEGRLTMDIFAADLWEVYKERAVDEYKNKEQFFKKSFLTKGIKNLLEVMEKRLKGEGGDPVIQIQTPFGGGKTHSLIAMYHKADDLCAKKIVIVGTAIPPDKPLWQLMEEELTGKNELFIQKSAPGRDAIRKFLEMNQPVLILIDELLEYITRAAGIKVEMSNLASQSIAFMQELTETVSTLPKACMIIALPSSIIEHYDQNAEELFQRLQKVSGRIERIYTPVEEDEITKVIRKRLFSFIDEQEATNMVNSFIHYFENENILPYGTEPSVYRDRFLASYPFMPEVVDILYHRWGSFPTFQRTRGVLRLLSLVIHSLKQSTRSYISLADFDLSNQEIRRELLKHIGSEYDSVIAADITSFESGSNKVDNSLGAAYRSLRLGKRVSTTIFMYSFSGGHERGVTSHEIKRNATLLGHPAAVISEVIDGINKRLFYLQIINDKYLFTNQPNLNRILLTKMENVKDEQIIELENEILKNSLSGSYFKTYIWPRKSQDIVDSEELKLIILDKRDDKKIEGFLLTKGQKPRVNLNTMIFLVPYEIQRAPFLNIVKKIIAYQEIINDKSLNLTEEQKKEITESLKKAKEDIFDAIRMLYRLVLIPSKEGLKEMDLGVPTYGVKEKIDKELYDKLKNNGDILERIAPLVIKEKYLKEQDYISTKKIYKSFLNIPGEPRILDKEVLIDGIKEGVQKGLFGIGEIDSENKIVSKFYKEEAIVTFEENEIIIKDSIIQKQEVYTQTGSEGTLQVNNGNKGGIITTPISPPTPPGQKIKRELKLRFNLPKGKVRDITNMLINLQSKFETLELNLVARDGEISEMEYEDKILELFQQLGVKVEEN
ncbi:MAG: ATP-binding protein [Deltaproteobacteria bacterium]|nr:ATP-binding protein [Deltaproteobacteria bacterium]